MQIEKLVYMANQIGKFFAPQGAEAEIAGVEDHLRKFWDPRMRTQIIDHVRGGGSGLDTNVALAVARLANHAAANKPS
jgi:formate dehydrogenase subunit delta